MRITGIEQDNEPMHIDQHPRQQLKKSWIDCLRSEAAAAEATGQLTKKQLALFYEQGWFKALAPKKYGGLQWSLSHVVRFEEAIGWAEGSAGWTFTLCSGAGWFGGFMEPGFAQKLFRQKKACLAGSGALGGRAMKDLSGKVMVDGNWKYATGAPHATLFTANYLIGKQNVVKTYGFWPKEVSVHNNWLMMGLKASASWAFSVLQVPLQSSRGFEIDPVNPFVDEVLYRFPFLALAEATIAANLSGMALHFLEEAEELWKAQGKIKRSSKQLRKTDALTNNYKGYLDRQFAKWQRASQLLHQSVNALERSLEDAFLKNTQQKITQTKKYLRQSGQVSEAAQGLAQVCRCIVFEVYGHTGLTGAHMESPLNKVWRDFQTGSQHALFEESVL